MNNTTIALASDHAGFDKKEIVKQYLEEQRDHHF